MAAEHRIMDNSIDLRRSEGQCAPLIASTTFDMNDSSGTKKQPFSVCSSGSGDPKAV